MELHLPLTLLLTIFSDNKGSIDLTNNPIIGKGTKHIDIKYHYIRQCVEDGLLTLHHLPSTNIIADLLTKQLSCTAFVMHHATLGLIKLDTLNAGGC
jgi:hypothetical protein